MHSSQSLFAVLILMTIGTTEAQVKKTASGPLGAGESLVYEGTVNLPAEGLWQPHDPDHQNAFRELYLVPSGSWRARQIGKRLYTVMETDAINS